MYTLIIKCFSLIPADWNSYQYSQTIYGKDLATSMADYLLENACNIESIKIIDTLMGEIVWEG